MGKTPKPPKPPEPVVDVEEAADVAVPVDSDAASQVRRRMAASRERVGRGQLRIPKKNSGISIPK